MQQICQFKHTHSFQTLADKFHVAEVRCVEEGILQLPTRTVFVIQSNWQQMSYLECSPGKSQRQRRSRAFPLPRKCWRPFGYTILLQDKPKCPCLGDPFCHIIQCIQILLSVMTAVFEEAMWCNQSCVVNRASLHSRLLSRKSCTKHDTRYPCNVHSPLLHLAFQELKLTNFTSFNVTIFHNVYMLQMIPSSNGVLSSKSDFKLCRHHLSHHCPACGDIGNSSSWEGKTGV